LYCHENTIRLLCCTHVECQFIFLHNSHPGGSRVEAAVLWLKLHWFGLLWCSRSVKQQTHSKSFDQQSVRRSTAVTRLRVSWCVLTPHLTTIPLMYCPYGNIVNCSRTSRIHFRFKNTLKNATQTYGDRNSQNPPSLGVVSAIQYTNAWGTPLTISNGIWIASCTFAQLRQKLPFGYNGTPHSHPKITTSLRSIPNPTICSSLDPADPPSKMASRSNQPFFHNSPIAIKPTDRHRQTDRQTDRHTDGLGDKPVSIRPAYAIYILTIATRPGASPRGGLGWTCPPHFCQRSFLRLMQIR